MLLFFKSHLSSSLPLFLSLRVAYGTSKIGVTALSKIQARAFSQDSREDILINAVSCRIININSLKPSVSLGLPC